MATAPPHVSDAAVEKATGRSWPVWMAIFRDMGAEEMAHKEIVVAAAEGHDVSGWWAQTLTVRFEQEIGRRTRGQTCEGDYQVSVSATLPGTMDESLARWAQHMEGRADFAGVPLNSSPAVTKSDNWRYWRVELADGSRVTVNFSDKQAAKALLQVNHAKLADVDAVETWRARWKALLNEHKKRAT